MDSTARLDEEEARRRRTTDCIYFLASPLTCKKGSECEYRHSDAARMNPRDCWYWFHGNCSNPKCSFRHPPLDNLLGTPTTPRATQQSAPQAPAPAPAPAATPAQAHGSFPAKQGVPCYYFQKGMCAKGDRCAFLHVPQSAGSGNPSPQPGVVATAKVFTPALQPNLQSKNSWTKPNSSSQQNTPAVGIINKSKVNAHDGNKPSAVQKQNLTATKADHSSRAYQNHGNSYAQSGGPKHYYQPHHQPSVEDDLTENSTEVGEFVREPSAGSGVIVGGVDHDAEQRMKGNHSTYQHHTNGNGTRQTHGGAYESESSYRSSAAERGVSHREHMPAVTAGSSDLRHRLLKQRKLNNNSRSTEPSARHDTHLEDERSDQHLRWRGEQRDGLLRSRLRDRIRLPGERETSFDRLGSRSEDWGSRGPPRARQSPPKHSDLRGKLHERLKARSAEETPAGSSAKNSSSGEDTGSLNFAGPKSLAELKAKKGGIGSSSGEDAIVKGVGSSRVTSEIVSSREGAATSPFEGPKPLSAILKRKREAASGSATASEEAEAEDAAGVEEEPQILTSDTAGENMEVNGDEEEEEEEAFHPEDDVAYDDNVDEATAAQELEELHQDVEVAAEDYDYEAEGGVAEEDNDYQEYQDDDDLEDDDDDFARKVGVMMS